jgi:putative Mg2+ transporter-C (MgtC) family protein
MGVGIQQIHIEDAEEGRIMIPITIKVPDRYKIEQIVAELGTIEGIMAIEKEPR